MKKDLSPCAMAERSINKKYRKAIWNKFIMAVKDYSDYGHIEYHCIKDWQNYAD